MQNIDYPHRGISCDFLLLKGFTLAEVLITLAVIGIVVALTLPMILNKIRNSELDASFKKTTSTLEQIVLYLTLDNEGFSEGNYDKTRTFKKVFIERLKGKDCTEFESMNCISKDENIYKDLTGKQDAWKSMMDDGHFVTAEGTLYMLNNSTGEPLLVTVDINGINKNPNQWGKDLFTFELSKGKLIPMGADNSWYPIKDYPKYCDTSKYEIRNGINCTIKAVQEKDYFKNLH